jgi:hypothetical protein
LCPQKQLSKIWPLAILLPSSEFLYLNNLEGHMKKLFLGTLATLSLLAAGAASAGTVDDFIGTWKLSSTTRPDYVVIKKEGDNLVALKYSRNSLSNKIVEQRFPAAYAADQLLIAAGDLKIDAKVVNGVASLSYLGYAYAKVSNATDAPLS